MGRKVLSPFSFYGGKDKMAPLICNLLDYKHTDLYIEPYGGACRVLLNKPKHNEEIYNDFGYGLCNFFQTLSDPKKSKEVITRLHEIVPTEEVFYEMLQYKMEHEQELTENMQKQFRKLVWNCRKKYQTEELKKLHSDIGKKEYQSIIDTIKTVLESGILQGRNERIYFEGYSTLYSQYWEIVEEEYHETYEQAKADFEAQWEKLVADNKKLNKGKEKQLHKYCHECALSSIEHFTEDTQASNGSEIDRDDIQMAVATFLTYYCSRDGMGLDYSQRKNKSLKVYYKDVQKLNDIAQRFEGVAVTQLDAMMLICQYCDCENVMMYLDPSYLKPEDVEKDLGKGVYNRSSSYQDHEALAYAIQDAKAKIVLSNYDVSPYKEILDEKHGWKKITFETTTGVGSKKNNKRTEVLWYNY